MQRADAPPPITTPRLPPVQATALASLRARARDARAPLSLLGDHHADALAARLGVELDEREPRRARASVVRSLVIDSWARSFLAASPCGTVVEVGVGLNTRFERLDNGSQRWIDVDLPEVVALRRGALPDVDRRHHVACSVTLPFWLEVIAASPPPYLFVMEALVAYLHREEIPLLLQRITRRVRGATIVLDVPRAWWRDGDPIRTLVARCAGVHVVETTAYLARCSCPRNASAPATAPYVLARLQTAYA